MTRVPAVGVCLRELEPEDAAARRVRLDPDLAAHALDEVLDDRQAEARAAGLARPARIGAVEPLEHALAMLVGDARAVVADLDADGIAELLAPRPTRGPRRCVYLTPLSIRLTRI